MVKKPLSTFGLQVFLVYDTENFEQIQSITGVEVSNFVFSPDGNTLYFTTFPEEKNTLYSLDISTTDDIDLVANPKLMKEIGQVPQGYCLQVSPDGKNIVFCVSSLSSRTNDEFIGFGVWRAVTFNSVRR